MRISVWYIQLIPSGQCQSIILLVIITMIRWLESILTHSWMSVDTLSVGSYLVGMLNYVNNRSATCTYNYG